MYAQGVCGIVGGRGRGAVHLYLRPCILAVTVREMRCLIVQSVGWEIGRRGGEDVLANMNEFLASPGLSLLLERQDGKLSESRDLEQDGQGSNPPEAVYHLGYLVLGNPDSPSLTA